MRHCTMTTANWTMHPEHWMLHTAHFTLYTADWTPYNVHCTLYSAYWTLHTAHCILPTAHCTLHTAYCRQHRTRCKLTHCTLHTRPYRVNASYTANLAPIQQHRMGASLGKPIRFINWLTKYYGYSERKKLCPETVKNVTPYTPPLHSEIPFLDFLNIFTDSAQFQWLRYQIDFCVKLLPTLAAKWLECWKRL